MTGRHARAQQADGDLHASPEAIRASGLLGRWSIECSQSSDDAAANDSITSPLVSQGKQVRDDSDTPTYHFCRG